MKNITIAGTIGRDAEIRDAGERRVTGWSVAVDDGWGDKKTTMWFDCNWWGKRGEALSPHINKGNKITVTGELKTREYNGATKMSVEVSDVTLQGGKPQDNHSQHSDPGRQAPASQGSAMDDADIPF
jgi:single-strand DNA-binding protein